MQTQKYPLLCQKMYLQIIDTISPYGSSLQPRHLVFIAAGALVPTVFCRVEVEAAIGTAVLIPSRALRTISRSDSATDTDLDADRGGRGERDATGHLMSLKEFEWVACALLLIWSEI